MLIIGQVDEHNKLLGDVEKKANDTTIKMEHTQKRTSWILENAKSKVGFCVIFLLVLGLLFTLLFVFKVL